MKKALVLVACLAVVSAVQAGFIVESRSTGQNFGNYSDSGFADSGSGAATAPGCTAIGSRYSGTTVYFGPTRQAVFTFTPGESGLYDIELAWPSTAGQKDTAVVLYTGASSGADVDPWGNAGPGGVVARTTMDMYYRVANVWNMAFDDVTLNAGTTYKVGIYGGHMSLNNAAAGDPSNRVVAGAVQFTAVPEPTTMLFVGLGLVGLITRRRSA